MTQDSTLFLFHKRTGITSHSAIQELRRKLNCKKIGHSGTLDKFASGLLVTLTNKATKLSSFFTELPKTYLAEICFGVQTDTLDPYGDIVARGSQPDRAAIEEALAQNFLGKIKQVPPEYSAVHVEGRRAYLRKRDGEAVQIPAREVEISEYSIEDYTAPLLSVRFHVSSGCYIRSIARDLAVACNTVAYLTKLVRLQVGPYTLDSAQNIDEASEEEFQKNTEMDSRFSTLLSQAFSVQESYVEDREVRKDVEQGKYPKILLQQSQKDKQFCIVRDAKGFLGLWKLKPHCKSVFHV